MSAYDPELSTAENLARRGYTHRAAAYGTRDVLDAAGRVVFSGTCWAVNDWLRAQDAAAAERAALIIDECRTLGMDPAKALLGAAALDAEAGRLGRAAILRDAAAGYGAPDPRAAGDDAAPGLLGPESDGSAPEPSSEARP